MQKLAKKLSFVMAALMIAFTALSGMTVKAAVVVPKVGYVEAPQLEYTAGDRVQFNLNAPNYGGRVQYRVVLWNDETKSYKDLWTTGDRYYTNWQPYGNETFTLGWPISEPGHYRITIYAKRAGLANSKTAQPGNNCDSFMQSEPFVVKAQAPAVDAAALLLTAYEKVDAYEKAPITTLDEVAKAEALKQPAVDAIAKLVEKDADKKAALQTRVDNRAKAIEAKKAELSKFAVVSVNAVNATQLLVSFNQEVAKTSAETTTNYSIGGSTPATAVLQADKKSVILTMSAVITGTNLYVVQPVVSAADATVKTAIFTQVEKYTDTVNPSVVKVEYPVFNKAKVTFSEPMANLGQVSFTQNGAALTGVITNDFTVGASVVTFDLSNASVVVDKPVTVVMVGALDKANNLINPNPSTLTFVKTKTDTTAPTVVDVKALSDVRLSVTFSEALAAAPTVTVGATPVTFAASDDNITWTGNFTSTTGVAIVAVSAGYADPTGNTGAAYSKLLQFAADTTAPKLVGQAVKVFNNKPYLVLSYDEDVVPAVANANITGTYVKNYVTVTLPTVNVVPVAYTKANGADVDNTKAVMFDISNDTNFPVASYTVSVPAGFVKDLASTPNNSAAASATFSKGTVSVSDTTAPTVSATTAPVFSADNAYLTVVFSENMDAATALNVANYKVGGMNIFSSAIFDQNAYTVKLAVNPGTIVYGGVYAVTISGAKDAAGNDMTAYYNNLTVKENVKPYAVSAKLTANNTIAVTMSEAVNGINASADFEVYVAGTKLATTDYSVSYASGVATITLNNAITDLSKLVQVKLVDTNVADLNGNTAVTGTLVTVGL